MTPFDKKELGGVLEPLSYLISWPGVYSGPIFPKNGITLANLEHNRRDMTAIVSAFTSDGFVIGADGRSLGKDKKVVCDCSQKIFNFKRQHIDVVYAWCGETHVLNESNELLYDLNTITQKALSSVAQGNDFVLFLKGCRDGIFDNLVKSPIVRKITNSNSVSTEKARMLLNGYFHGEPFTAEIYIRDVDRIRIDVDNILKPIPSPTRNLFSGCNEQNAKYANVSLVTAQEALKFVSDYIQDCIDNPEPDCFIVGGRRHIAHLDSDGFSWVEEPEKSVS
jgi:hypothetical protein